MFFIRSIIIGCVISFCSLESSDARPLEEQHVSNNSSQDVKSAGPLLSLFNIPSMITEQFTVQQNTTDMLQNTTTRLDEQTTKLHLNLLDINKNPKEIISSNNKRPKYIVPVEMTLYRPRFTKNAQGYWVPLNKDFMKLGLWENTVFNQISYKKAVMFVDEEISNYYPDNNIRTTVCLSELATYPIPHVGWVGRGVNSVLLPDRAFQDALRREIFNVGRSEECHNVARYSRFLSYQECAILRNMRLEYYIPNYPLIQIAKDIYPKS